MVKVERCKSCAARIVWAVTELGKRMPVDADPHQAGNITLLPRPLGAPLAHVLQRYETAEERPLYRAHFVSCPNARDWRRR